MNREQEDAFEYCDEADICGICGIVGAEERTPI